MAKFVSGDLRLKNGQKVTFTETNGILYSDLLYDGVELGFTTVVSGIYPTKSFHLTPRQYVDDQIASLSGAVDEHNELLNIQGGTTNEYYHLTSVQRTVLTDVGGVADASSQHNHDSIYFTENEITTISGDIVNQIITDHGGLTGLADDDHTQYILVDGTRAFTGTVGGITPTDPNDLTTKQYVDMTVNGLDWQNSVLSRAVAYGDAVASGTNRYIAPTTSGAWIAEYIYEWTGTSWSGTEPDEGFATWIEDEDIVHVYNDAYPVGNWVKFGSTVTHNNLNGLQGGTTNEYYHLTSTMYTDLSSFGGVVDAGAQHHHDSRYYTETEIDTTLSGYSLINHAHVSTDITDFNEAAQDAVGNIMVGAGTVTVTYDDIGNTITVSGNTSGAGIDHGTLDGLGDDDHPVYVPRDGSRGFISTVSGVYPIQNYELTTKQYVDNMTASGGIDRHGRESIANGASTVTVAFADLGHINYTVNTTMENTSDSPPSIYAFIVSGRTSSSFTTTFMGDMDSANYKLNWTIIED